MKLGAAPEIDRHTLQLSEPPPTAMAVSPRVTNSHGHHEPIALLMRYTLSQCIARARARLLWPWELVTRSLVKP